MKKVTLLLAGFLFALTSLTAQVSKELVVFEIATGVNCPYCPAAANGAYDLLENGHNVAVAAYHTPSFSIPQFYTTETTSRVSWYGISSYPTTKVDGILTQSGGGGAGQSNYAAYVSLYNQRIGVMSDFTVDLAFENVSGDDYEAIVTVEKVGSGTYNNLKLVVNLTESDINYSWMGMPTLSFVTRDMIPNQNGTALDFSGGNVLEFTLPFTIPAGVERNNCELIAFVQNFTNKEIYQGTKKTMRQPDYVLDAELFSVANMPDQICAGILEPELTIRNMGAEVLTTLNINFEVNGELVETYEWSGNLEFFEGEMIEVPEFVFDAEDENEIVVYLSDPNGGTDENPDNDSQTFETELPEVCEDYLVLIMKTDDNPGETTWECLDASGNVIKTGGPYTQPNLFTKDTVFFETPGCHQFIMYDAAGNGLSTYYTLRSYVEGSITTIYSGGAFGYKEDTHFTVDAEGVSAAFTSNVNEGCEELTVDFIDNSAGAVIEWNWVFEGGDPATSTEQNPTVFYAVPGVYDVTLTVSDGTNTNTYTDEDCIEVFALPMVEFDEVPDQCLNWPAYELVEGSPAGGEYSGPGVMDGFFYPEDAGVGTHVLTYTYTDANGCENYDEQEVYVDGCVGISDPSKGFVLEIYPNPVTNSSTIEFYLNSSNEVSVTLYNSIGMKVKEFSNGMMNAGSHKLTLNSAEFENGIYFIRFKAGDQVTTEKITIVK